MWASGKDVSTVTASDGGRSVQRRRDGLEIWELMVSQLLSSCVLAEAGSKKDVSTATVSDGSAKEMGGIDGPGAENLTAVIRLRSSGKRIEKRCFHRHG